MSWQARLSGLLDAGGEIWRWSLDRVRGQLPMPLRTLGWHDQAGVFRLSDSGEREAVGIRQVSWLGETRLMTAGTQACEEQARRSLVLPQTRQFRTILPITPMAARRGRSALDLRQDRFMPLAEGQGCYAHEIVDDGEDDRIAVHVAVARISDLNRIAAEQPDDMSWEIAGDLAADGRSRFILAEGGRQGASGALKPVLLLALVLLALFAWQGRLQSRAGDEMAAQREQALAVRQLREADAMLASLEARRSIGGHPVHLGDVLQTLSVLPDSLAESDRIQRIRLTGQRSLDVVLATGEGDALSIETQNLPVQGGGE